MCSLVTNNNNLQKNQIYTEQSLLDNGLDFISDALDHYLKSENENLPIKDKQHELKYAILHLHSGITLVLKSILYFEHWTYIFANMNEANLNNLKTGSFKSIESSNIISRLNQLCNTNITNIDKENYDNLRNLRNKLEHFKLTNEYTSNIENKFNYALSFIIRFISEHYNELNQAKRDMKKKSIGLTKSEKDLVKTITLKARKIKFHYNNALNFAKQQAITISEKNSLLICPYCNEETLSFRSTEDNLFHCFFCGFKGTATELAYTLSDFVYYCPNCGNEAFIYNPTDNKWICYSCDETYEKNIHVCSNCQNIYLSNDETEDELGLCNQCIENKILDD